MRISHSILLYSDQVNIELSNHSLPNGSKTGTMYLTTHRLIFINKNQQDKIQSFSLPFVTLKDVSVIPSLTVPPTNMVLIKCIFRLKLSNPFLELITSRVKYVPSQMEIGKAKLNSNCCSRRVELSSSDKLCWRRLIWVWFALWSLFIVL